MPQGLPDLTLPGSPILQSSLHATHDTPHSKNKRQQGARRLIEPLHRPLLSLRGKPGLAFSFAMSHATGSPHSWSKVICVSHIHQHPLLAPSPPSPRGASRSAPSPCRTQSFAPGCISRAMNVFIEGREGRRRRADGMQLARGVGWGAPFYLRRSTFPLNHFWDHFRLVSD